MNKHKKAEDGEMQNYVTPAPLPGPFQAELLDIVAEECVEVLQGLLALTDASTRTDVAASEAASGEVASEAGNLAFIIDLALRHGLFEAPGKVVPEERCGASLGSLKEACIRLAQRCSKANRFSLSERQEGKPHENAERIAAEAARFATITGALLRNGRLDQETVARGRLEKKAKLRRFLQHNPDGTRRVREPENRAAARSPRNRAGNDAGMPHPIRIGRQEPHAATTEPKMSTETRMVAIFRADLPLPPGKMAAQAGHAFLTAWRMSRANDPHGAEAYADDSQAKIVLLAPDLAALERVAAKAGNRGIAHAMITDAARTVLKEPAVTVLGLGPMSKTDCNALKRGLQLL